MASSLLLLLDDITSVLDDVAVLTKLATKKTAGVLGDDLALNAQQVTGVRASRELPVVWAVAKGSLLNKAILVPAALAISAFAPWLVTPLLMLGGAFLCYEGFEKVWHRWFHTPAEDAEDTKRRGRLAQAVKDASVDVVALEKQKIKGAIRTDFILSAEIIVIALGTVAGQPFGVQVAVLVGIALLMTVGVYGLVAGIVKLDDAGLYLAQSGSAFARAVGTGIVRAAPWLMKFLSFAGTLAMFLVGGGILTHGIGVLHHAIESWAHLAEGLPGVGAILGPLTPTLANLAAGILAGAIAVAVVALVRKLRPRSAEAGASGE
jgi:predicted DNA repair protein MutK